MSNHPTGPSRSSPHRHGLPVGRSSRRALVLTLIALVAASAPSADSATVVPPIPPAPRILIPKLTAQLTLDGELNESVWAQAAVIPSFSRNDGTGPEREATTLRIWYDDTALYLGWTCRDTDIQATFTARDSKFWEEEVVEFFVTRQDLARYYEFQWNPLGGVFDAIIDNDLDAQGFSKKITGDWSFTASGMRHAVKVRGTVSDATDRDELWQVEVTLPFVDFAGAPPKPGEQWRGNFFRFNRGRGVSADLVSWSPTHRKGFHEPSRFGVLEFGP